MESFTQETKTLFVNELEEHAAADAFLRGTYCEDEDVGNAVKFRGCAVGCGLHSLERAGLIAPSPGEEMEYGDHAGLAKLLGIPEELTRLQDSIFESLPLKQAMQWPLLFARAIPVGRDLSLVWPHLAVWLLSDETHGVRRHARPDGQAAIDTVIALYQRRIAGNEPTKDEWRKAAAAADAAAAAADAARWAAAAAAARWAAADAAADAAAAAAAYAAARWAAAAAAAAAYAAARWAAADAAREKFWIALSEKLTELMAAA